MPYTDKEIIAALHQITDELGHSPTAAEMNAHDDTPSATTCGNQFGSWNKALQAAGLDTAGYSEEKLLTLLQELAEMLGRRPTSTDIAAHDELPNLSTFIDHFGTWNGALVAAELDINEVYAHDREKLHTELAWLTRDLGRVPTKSDINEQAAVSVQSYQSQFGSVSEAYESLALDPPPKRTRLADRTLITDLQAAVQYDDPTHKTITPTKRAFHDWPHPPKLYTDRFGSVAEALVEAGIDPTRHITREEIIEEIRALAEQVGCTPGETAPTIDDLREHGAISQHVVTQAFETWNEAVAAAGYVPNESFCESYTKIPFDDLADDLLNVAVQSGGAPTQDEYEALGQYGTTTIERRYGSWHRFLKLVELTPHRNSPGRWARGTPPTIPSVDREPGPPESPRVDRLWIDCEKQAVQLRVGDIILDQQSPLRTFEIIDIQVEATALTPVWTVLTHPTVLDQPYTRTVYGDELRDRFVEGTMHVYSQESTAMSALPDDNQAW